MHTVINKIQSVINKMQEEIKHHEEILDDLADHLNEDELAYVTSCFLEASMHMNEAFKCYDDVIEKLQKDIPPGIVDRGNVKKDISPDIDNNENLPSDYEPCGYCGFDHGYEYEEAYKWHKEHPGEGYPEPEDLNSIVDLANALDASDDEVLQKQASVLDEILLAMGSDRIKAFNQAQQDELDKLRQKYRENREDFKIYSEKNKDLLKYRDAAKESIDKNIKKYRPLEAPLQTRHSPDMPGVQLIRIGDGIYQDPVTKKIYDYNTGYVTVKGDKVPGTNVSNQSRLDYTAQDSMSFANRESILNGG